MYYSGTLSTLSSKVSGLPDSINKNLYIYIDYNYTLNLC